MSSLTQRHLLIVAVERNTPAETSPLPSDSPKWFIEDLGGYNLITYAAVRNNAEFAGFMLEHQKEMHGSEYLAHVINFKDERGNTAMHYFALRRNESMLEKLVSMGGNKSVKNALDQTVDDVLRDGKLAMYFDMPTSCLIFGPDNDTWVDDAVFFKEGKVDKRLPLRAPAQ